MMRHFFRHGASRRDDSTRDSRDITAPRGQNLYARGCAPGPLPGCAKNMTKSTLPKSPRPVSPLAKPAPSRNPFALNNQSFNQQSRKLLAKHYRAKYGVK
jgi:hypothetical protein